MGPEYPFSWAQFIKSRACWHTHGKSTVHSAACDKDANQTHIILWEVLHVKIEPIDIEALERTKQPWNPHYITSVMSDLLSRQRGYPVGIILTPKEPGEQRDR